ncbi:unnamed protein product [Cuscuta campestris]|uniref:Uncharacterized protein n=1 Tax=Cuscuta campestris TaxID=132261 RepID=A0A484LQF2_9ASTE|nr:unnamed protein product [Cuscuta campestris]
MSLEPLESTASHGTALVGGDERKNGRLLLSLGDARTETVAKTKEDDTGGVGFLVGISGRWYIGGPQVTEERGTSRALRDWISFP